MFYLRQKVDFHLTDQMLPQSNMLPRVKYSTVGHIMIELCALVVQKYWLNSFRWRCRHCPLEKGLDLLNLKTLIKGFYPIA